MDGKHQQSSRSSGQERIGEAGVFPPKVNEPPIAERNAENPVISEQLTERICERTNLLRAFQRVQRNKGCAGVDGMSTTELRRYLKRHWLVIKEELVNGTYKPKPVLRVDIPKPDGGTRKLGIPTVLDRFIQQAMLQILQLHWEDRFSEHSYGFRPNRSQHGAIAEARKYVDEGYEWVVDIDLERFFDRVNHDRLMSTLAKTIQDKRVLKLLRLYLNAGVLEDGMVQPVTEGTPQGGPLSPLLSNIVLDELDKELERRGHRFVRYADDCNIYVKSRRAGERVMNSVKSFINKKLKLKVNEKKSAVDKSGTRKLLGISIGKENGKTVLSLSAKSRERLKDRIRSLTSPCSGRSIETIIEKLSGYLRGWFNYYRIVETPEVFADLDGWIRHRIRAIIWRQWKTPEKRKQELLRFGVRRPLAESTSQSSKGPWHLSNTSGVNIALSIKYLRMLGLYALYSKMA
jgi:RNA-directed DNA polymerase